MTKEEVLDKLVELIRESWKIPSSNSEEATDRDLEVFDQIVELLEDNDLIDSDECPEE